MRYSCCCSENAVATVSKTNAYLTLAHRALRIARRPLTPQEMLDIAVGDAFLPDHLFGATMHKTLAARLSEHIRLESSHSDFYRTAPGTYFLHELAADPLVPDEYKRVHVGHLRSKAIRKENVLVAPRSLLQGVVYGEFVPFDEAQFKDLYQSMCRFMDRGKAEEDESVKQFVTFTLVFHDSKILSYRRGKFTTTSDTLKGQQSVGFGGHVNDKDFSLFTMGGDAFRANAARELREELFLDDVYAKFSETIGRTKLLGYVNVDSSRDAEHHVAVLVAFQHVTATLPRKGELSINQLKWLDLREPKNDLSDFDLWSAMILQNIYEGKIIVPTTNGDDHG